MGSAARKLTTSGRARSARPRLRLVPVVPRRPSSARTRRASAASRVFRLALAGMLVFGAVALARVALAVQAAEAAIDAGALRAEIKSERSEIDVLETDRSSLVSPSRIENLACVALDMRRPSAVRYIELPSDSEKPQAEPGEQSPAPGERPGLVATIMDLAAGEAQVLLVGDMGLGSR